MRGLTSSPSRRTLPSHIRTFAPLLCQLKISSLGPQFVWLQGHVGGPPNGFLFPFTGKMGLLALLLGWPETPPVLAGSAQRLKTWWPLGVALSPAGKPCDDSLLSEHHWL